MIAYAVAMRPPAVDVPPGAVWQSPLLLTEPWASLRHGDRVGVRTRAGCFTATTALSGVRFLDAAPVVCCAGFGWVPCAALRVGVVRVATTGTGDIRQEGWGKSFPPDPPYVGGE